MKWALLVIAVAFTFPHLVMGAVTINEIAWMGSDVSANHEWIELYNDGPAQNLDGWLLSDGESININLTGTVGTQSYAVLERTSDDSAPGVAFLLYTGALKNTGATLSLYRADGGLEDRVVGGEDWQTLGGDNTTKETAQYTTSGWITAPATPGEANATQTFTTTEATPTVSASTGSARLATPVGRNPVTLTLPGDTLALEIQAPEQVFVNQPVVFDVIPTGIGDTIQRSLKYQWNFGDTHLSSTKEPTHAFLYPGTYMVHVSASYGTQDTFTTKEITVLPVTLSLTKNRDGDVQINNDAAYAIDLSGYRLRAQDVIELPANTWLLPRQTITVPRSKVHASHNTLVALYDAKGALVSSVMPARFVATAPIAVVRSETPTSPTPRVVPPVTTNTAFQFAQTAEAAETNDLRPAEIVPVLEPANSSSRQYNWPLLAFILLLSLSCIVVLMQPFLKKSGLDTHE
jgi:hypothetical protein